MALRSLAVLSLLLTAACSQVTAERQSSVTVQGETYPVVTKTMQSGSRTFEVSNVRVGGMIRQCNASLRGSCEAAVTEALNPLNSN